MGSSKKTAQPQPDVVARLTAQVEALTARLDMLEGSPRHSENGNGQNKAPQSRRDLLKLAGAAAAGAAGSILIGNVPAAATSGRPKWQLARCWHEARRPSSKPSPTSKGAAEMAGAKIPQRVVCAGERIFRGRDVDAGARNNIAVAEPKRSNARHKPPNWA